MAHLPQIKLSYGFHNQSRVVKAGFTYNFQIKELLKSKTKAKWSQTIKSWYIPEIIFDLHAFLEEFRGIAHIDNLEFKKKKPQKLLVSPTVEIKKKETTLLPKGYEDIL